MTLSREIVWVLFAKRPWEWVINDVLTDPLEIVFVGDEVFGENSLPNG